MKHCVIFGARPISAAMRPFYETADVLIAADAGWQSAKELGLVPDICLGDYDSAAAPQGAERLPAEKDDTDTHYAAKKALALGATHVTILGGLGGRLDHTLANFQTVLFLQQQGVQAVLADENTEMHVLLPGTHTVPQKDSCYVSLFPISELATGVTLQGLKYPLQNAVLSNVFPIGVSNEFAAENAIISLKTGGLYMLICRKESQT